MKWLKSILSDSKDNPSSKRLAGFILIFAGIGLAFVGKEYTQILLIGSSLLSLGIADNFINQIKK